MKSYKKLIGLSVLLVGILVLSIFTIDLLKTRGNSDTEWINFSIEDTTKITKIVIEDTYGQHMELIQEHGNWHDEKGECVSKPNVSFILEAAKLIEFKGYLPDKSKKRFTELMSTQHIKVSYYIDGEWTKSWYIGPPTQDHYGQIMLLETEEAGKSSYPVMMSISGMSVVIVEDDSFTRLTLSSLLREMGCVVVGEAGTVAQALEVIAETQPQLVLIDLDLGEGPTGNDLAHAIRETSRDIKIVVLSTFLEPRLMGSSHAPLPDGSVFVVKRSVTGPEVLEQAFRMAGSVPDSEGRVLAVSLGESRHILAQLSDAQVDILRLIATGYSNAEIARRLVVNERTVEKTIARLIKQLDVQTDKDQNQRVVLTQIYFRLIGVVGSRNL